MLVPAIQAEVWPLPLEPPSHLPPHPSPLGGHRAKGVSSLHHRANSHSYPFCVWWCLCFHGSLSSRPTLSFPHCVHQSVLSICLFSNHGLFWWHDSGGREGYRILGTVISCFLSTGGISIRFAKLQSTCGCVKSQPGELCRARVLRVPQFPLWFFWDWASSVREPGAAHSSYPQTPPPWGALPLL